MGLSGRALPALRIAGLTVAVALVAAAGVGYWFFVSQQRDYIIGRDFRILTNLTKQIDSTAHAEALVIQNLPKQSHKEGLKALRDTWSNLRGKPYKPADITFEIDRRSNDRVPAEASLRAGSLTLEVPLENAGTQQLTASLNLQPALETLFSSTVGPAAFDAILLGTRSGRVLVSAGSGAEQLRLSGLDVLSTKETEGSKPLKFKELSEAITMADVFIGGVEYTLFVAPCCMQAKAPEDRLVLAGLVRSDKVRAGSWAIPTTLVKLSVLALLIVLVAWPFLKLVLLGDRQQVGITDFFQLGASGVAGLAILTVVLLDVSAYWRLNRDLDAQLSELAHSLDSNAKAEITDAYAQLTCLEDAVQALGPAKLDKRIKSTLVDPRLKCPPPGETAAPASHERLSTEAPAIEWRYPFFDTVAFIDASGKQQLKLVTSANPSNLIDVGQRQYFKTIKKGGGWKANDFCNDSPCALESVWSRTTGEAQSVLATTTGLKLKIGEKDQNLAVAAISFPMRSLIGPVLPPGFAFAVIDDSGEVLFHSDRQRNGNENFFVETDSNRRLRAQVAAHSADALNLNYWGAQYRAYVKPMQLPGMYVVAMAQSERAWAINREWLVVTLTLLAAYLLLWLAVAMFTLAPGASWVWPDPGRRERYRVVSIVCVVLLGIAIATAKYGTPAHLVLAGVVLPLVGWGLAFLLLMRSPRRRRSGGGLDTLAAYSVASVLVLLVAGVIPGSMFFLASYRLHAWSYIKNSQLIVAHRLAERYDRLSEAYSANSKRPAAWYTNIVSDRDIYVDFLYGMSVTLLNKPGDTPLAEDDGHEQSTGTHAAEHHNDDMLLLLLEDYLPYYSEASVEWRELLHHRSHDETWESWRGARDVDAVLKATTGRLTLELRSWVPSISSVPTTVQGQETNDLERSSLPTVEHASAVPPQPAREDALHDESSDRTSIALLFVWGGALIGLAWGVVEIFNRRVYLVGITQPLWARGSLVRHAGQNVLVLCDARSKAEQLKGMTSLDLMPIVKADDFKCAWRKALFHLDRKSNDGSVLIADFDRGLDDVRSMDRKLLLLEELVFDPARRVVVLSKVSLRGLIDSVRLSAGASSAAPDAREAALERWRRIVKALVIVERRQPKASPDTPHEQRSPAVTFLLAERESHPDVRRVCDDLLQSDAVAGGRLSRAQAFDELVERTLQCYRGLWMSCSEDEKVVLGHVAKHGLANSSARSIVRQLLGRGILHADPALRPMNETFRHFILTRECSKQVEALESEDGPSAWDRLRVPLGLAVVGAGLFLFATQKELYNAIFGLVTAAAASVPALIQTVGKLVGQPTDGPGQKA